MQVRVKENAEEFGKCGCGRSPTGKCMGWHNLTESEFQSKLAQYILEEQKNIDDRK
jgi:phage protein D